MDRHIGGLFPQSFQERRKGQNPAAYGFCRLFGYSRLFGLSLPCLRQHQPDSPVEPAILAFVRILLRSRLHPGQFLLVHPCHDRSEDRGQRDILHGIVDDSQHGQDRLHLNGVKIAGSRLCKGRDILLSQHIEKRVRPPGQAPQQDHHVSVPCPAHTVLFFIPNLNPRLRICQLTDPAGDQPGFDLSAGIFFQFLIGRSHSPGSRVRHQQFRDRIFFSGLIKHSPRMESHIFRVFDISQISGHDLEEDPVDALQDPGPAPEVLPQLDLPAVSLRASPFPVIAISIVFLHK